MLRRAVVCKLFASSLAGPTVFPVIQMNPVAAPASRRRNFLKIAPPGRSKAVDFLRGIAVLLVLGCHFVVRPDEAGFLAPLAGLWYRIGWAGVDLFFVLSGFLVSGLLFAEFKRNQRVDARRFLVRRALKIWPAYFVYITFIAAWLFWQEENGQAGVWGWESTWPNILHVQNYFGSPRGHTWSLAVEEHFYLVGVALAALLLKGRRVAFAHRVFPTAAIAGLVVVAWMRHAGFAEGNRAALNLFATHLRFDGLLVGSLVAYFAHFGPGRLKECLRRPVFSILIGGGLAAPALLFTPNHSAMMAGAGLSFMYVGFALFMLGMIGLEQGTERAKQFFSSLTVKGIARLGFFSYGIYLWHVDLAQTPMKKVALIVGRAGFPEWATWFGVTAAYLLLAVAAGVLMSRLIELPFLVARDRLFPSKVQPASPAAAGEENAPATPTILVQPTPALAG